jgi:hypothetical protein
MLRELSLSLPQMLRLGLEGPLLAGQGIAPEVAFINRDDHHSLSYELCQQPSHPKSLLIEAWVSILKVGLLERTIPEVEDLL